MIIQNYYHFLVVVFAFVVLTSWCQQESSALQVVLLRPGAGGNTQPGAHAQASSRATTQLQRLDMSATPGAITSLMPKRCLWSEKGVMLSSEKLQERLQGKRVALYFSAGWCPMCTKFEPALLHFQQAQAENNTPIEFIYVSSDRRESDSDKRAANMKMLSVAFDQTSNYKKNFMIWAGSEGMKFGFKGRRSGVPALVVLDNKHGKELAFIPAESQGIQALEKWPLDDDVNGIW